MKFYIFKNPDIGSIKMDIGCESDSKVSDISEAEMFISLGGDGTFLKMLHTVIKTIGSKAFSCYFMGLNLGHVGFLTNEIGSLNLTAPLEIYTNKEFVVDRFPIILKADNTQRILLNELVIKGKNSGKLFDVKINVNNESDVLYRGDGVIISSPSGSTAYNLSANGPMMHPEMKGIIVTPICPFTLADRSVLLPKHSVINIDADDYELYGDGMLINAEGNLSICLSDLPLNTICINNFIDTIKEKLGWNKSIK